MKKIESFREIISLVAIMVFCFFSCDNGNNTPAKTYTVTFIADNGMENITQTIAVGEKASKPTNPVKEGYGFAYWFNETTGNEWNFDSVITTDINLKAKWDKIFESVTITSIEQLAVHLANLDTNTIRNPIPVNIILNLDVDWENLLTILNTANMFVDLDLSDSTGMTIFNPGSRNTGEKFIVSLIFPNSVTEITPANGEWGQETFRYFTVLKEVSASNIAAVNWLDFNGVTSLTKASFPMATNIQDRAFRDCVNLTDLTIPATANVSGNAFYGCRNLTTFNLIGTGPGQLRVVEGGKALIRNDNTLVAYPAASGNIEMNTVTRIDSSLFSGNPNIVSVSFPDVTWIGSSVFAGCSGLKSTNFPALVFLGGGAFYAVNLYKVTLGIISEENFTQTNSFYGNLRDVYFSAGGGAGTYTTINPGDSAMWLKE